MVWRSEHSKDNEQLAHEVELGRDAITCCFKSTPRKDAYLRQHMSDNNAMIVCCESI